ncbi:MAG: hypothetical protein ACI4FX_10000 [Agathobacter sp.]
MSNHSEEDYLDQLLYSMGDGSSTKKTVKEKKPATTQEEFEQELFGVPVSEQDKAKDEEEFLREFEAELLQDELPDVSEQFGEEIFSDESSGQERDPLEESLDEVLANMAAEKQAPPTVDEDAEFEGELPEETKEQANVPTEEEKTLDQAMDAFDENISAEEPSAVEEPSAAAAPPEGETNTDLSGMEDQDLMELLSQDADLADLGELLSDQEEGKPVAKEDSFEDFAKAQMDEQKQAVSQATEQEAPESEASDGGKRNRKKSRKNKEKNTEKKSSVFQKLSKMFFGDDQEDIVEIPDDGTGELVELSEENQQILKELAEADQKESSGKKPKEKKKKEKKKKAPKPKKEKKKKPPKPKKEKKPKPVDNTPPLPRGPVIAIVILVVSLLGLVLLGTSTLGYQANVNAAKEFYQKGAYVEGFQKLQGLNIKQKDEKLYNRLAALAAVSEKYQAYLIFDNYGSKDMALDSLVCAYGRYEINQKFAEEYECEPELEALKTKITDALKADFSMSQKEASQLYQIKDRDDYTIEIHKKLDELGFN